MDAHVHVYECFNVGNLLQSAWLHFSDQARNQPFVGVLMLTETARESWFRRLTGVSDGWVVHDTADSAALRLEGPSGESIYVVAGRQLTTSERLEVHGLFVDKVVPDGMPLQKAVDQVRDSGGVVVLPWAFGKWAGARGEQMTRYIKRSGGVGLFVGDNGGCPALIREPTQFTVARRLGVRILGGTDPLPIPLQERRTGSYGFSVRATFDLERPATSLRKVLESRTSNFCIFGRRVGVFSFVRNQLLLRLQRH